MVGADQCHRCQAPEIRRSAGADRGRAPLLAHQPRHRSARLRRAVLHYLPISDTRLRIGCERFRKTFVKYARSAAPPDRGRVFLPLERAIALIIVEYRTFSTAPISKALLNGASA